MSTSPTGPASQRLSPTPEEYVSPGASVSRSTAAVAARTFGGDAAESPAARAARMGADLPPDDGDLTLRLVAAALEERGSPSALRAEQEALFAALFRAPSGSASSAAVRPRVAFRSSAPQPRLPAVPDDDDDEKRAPSPSLSEPIVARPVPEDLQQVLTEVLAFVGCNFSSLSEDKVQALRTSMREQARTASNFALIIENPLEPLNMLKKGLIDVFVEFLFQNCKPDELRGLKGAIPRAYTPAVREVIKDSLNEALRKKGCAPGADEDCDLVTQMFDAFGLNFADLQEDHESYNPTDLLEIPDLSAPPPAPKDSGSGNWSDGDDEH